MNQPMEPGQTPAESEFSFGPGMMPNPGRGLPSRTGAVNNTHTTRDMVNQLWMERRTDPTDATSVADYTVKGNPDRFGGQPALVQESDTLPASTIDVTAPGGIPGNTLAEGVTREG